MPEAEGTKWAEGSFGGDRNSLYCEYKGGYTTVTFVKVHITEHKRLLLLLISYSATNLTVKAKRNFVIRKCGSRGRRHYSLGSGKNGEYVPSQLHLNW